MLKITKPTLLVDEKKVRRNIGRITKKAEITGTAVIPHFKTHQSIIIGRWFRDFGVSAITVSSLSMARYFVADGWANIYIAFPLNLREIAEFKQLASDINLTVLVTGMEQVNSLMEQVNTPVKIKIEIECGSNRSGLLATQTTEIKALLEMINKSRHYFDGFYSHFGHTYGAKSVKEVAMIFEASNNILLKLKEEYRDYKAEIACGDTPSASTLADFSPFKSVHAGNYVFYDLTQSQIGVCDESDIAIALAAPIVSKNPHRQELVLYGGGVHLSKERMLSEEYNSVIYGKLVAINSEGWSKSLPNCYLSSISQEHGIAKVSKEVFHQYQVGDVLGVLPVHSCMTADVMRAYNNFSGQLIDHFKGEAVK